MSFHLEKSPPFFWTSKVYIHRILLRKRTSVTDKAYWRPCGIHSESSMDLIEHSLSWFFTGSFIWVFFWKNTERLGSFMRDPEWIQRDCQYAWSVASVIYTYMFEIIQNTGKRHKIIIKDLERRVLDEFGHVCLELWMPSGNFHFFHFEDEGLIQFLPKLTSLSYVRSSDRIRIQIRNCLNPIQSESDNSNYLVFTLKMRWIIVQISYELHNLFNNVVTYRQILILLYRSWITTITSTICFPKFGLNCLLKLSNPVMLHMVITWKSLVVSH